MNFSLAYVGYGVLAPFLAFGVEAGLRYSDPAAIEERLRSIVADFCATLPRPPSERQSLSTVWKSGGRMAASCRAPRSTRRLSAESSTLSWNDRAGPQRKLPVFAEFNNSVRQFVLKSGLPQVDDERHLSSILLGLYSRTVYVRDFSRRSVLSMTGLSPSKPHRHPSPFGIASRRPVGRRWPSQGADDHVPASRAEDRG